MYWVPNQIPNYEQYLFYVKNFVFSKKYTSHKSTVPSIYLQFRTSVWMIGTSSFLFFFRERPVMKSKEKKVDKKM